MFTPTSLQLERRYPLKRDLSGLKRKSTRSSPEQDVKNAILEWFALFPRKFLAWPNNSTGTYDPVRKIFRRPPKHFLPGTGDIFVLCSNGMFISIECKSPKGRVRPEQDVFIDKVNEFKGYSFVARSLDDVVNRLGRLV